MNPLGLVATIIYTYAAVLFVIDGNIELAAAAFFMDICAIVRQKQLTQIMAIYYLLLGIQKRFGTKTFTFY